jgi:tetratricopeptide (TPR) repeat protein
MCCVLRPVSKAITQIKSYGSESRNLMADTNDLLQQGIALAKAGRRDEARNTFLQVVELDERNESAWLWLSGVVDSDDDRAIALENVLAINPDNEWAKRGLQLLGRPLPGASA